MQSKLSHSALETFRTCPRKFKFDKIEKVRVYKPIPAHMLIGTAVHGQVRKAFESAAAGKLYTLAEMLEGYNRVFEGPNRDKVAPGSDSSTVDEDIERGRRTIGRFFAQYQPFDQGQHLFAEKSFSFRLADCPVEFSARVDRVWKRGDGVYEITDFKTGKMVGPKDAVFKLQMGLYQLAVQDSFPDWTIEVAQYFLSHGEEVRYRMRPDELDELAEQLKNEVHEIARAERLDDWPTREANHCRFCDFFDLCPAKRHQSVMEEGEEGEAPQAYRDAAAMADVYLALDTDAKRIKNELAALKEEIVTAARDLKVSKFRAKTGQVTVTLKPVEKLPTKTNDPKKYVEMVTLVRSWDDATRELCLKPDETTLMGLYHKNRLMPEQKAALGELIQKTEQATVRSKLDKPVDSDDADEGDAE